MKRQFLTVKVVEAEEVTEGDYYQAQGYGNGYDNFKEKVYRIFYENGYVSMLPKNVFLGNAYEIENNSITPEVVKSFIKNTEITTERIYGKLNTVLSYELVNGFVGIETSSCVDEKNYSKEIGEQILLERLYDKIWFGLGFALGMANKYKEVK